MFLLFTNYYTTTSYRFNRFVLFRTLCFYFLANHNFFFRRALILSWVLFIFVHFLRLFVPKLCSFRVLSMSCKTTIHYTIHTHTNPLIVLFLFAAFIQERRPIVVCNNDPLFFCLQIMKRSRMSLKERPNRLKTKQSMRI